MCTGGGAAGRNKAAQGSAPPRAGECCWVRGADTCVVGVSLIALLRWLHRYTVSPSRIQLAMEYMPGGSLFQALHKGDKVCFVLYAFAWREVLLLL